MSNTEPPGPEPKLTKYLSSIAEERNLPYYFRSFGSLVIRGRDDTALELDCGTTNIKLYYFHSFTNDAISYCDDFDISEPDSIDKIMKWMDKL